MAWVHLSSCGTNGRTLYDFWHKTRVASAGYDALRGCCFLVKHAAQAQPVAIAPYTLTTLTNLDPPRSPTMPDDLAVTADGADLWVGYGNGVDTKGQGGPSDVVEYEIKSGAVLHDLIIPGHVDGLKINPTTNDIWATENEDGNPTLAIINQQTGTSKIFSFSPTLITGGLDDLVFPGRDSNHVFLR